VDEGGGGLLDVAVSGEPINRAACGGLNIDGGEQELGQSESGITLDTRNRHGARHGWVHELPFARFPSPRRLADLGGRELGRPADLGGRELGAQCSVLRHDGGLAGGQFTGGTRYGGDLTY